jgi:hypothetical protein
LNEQQQVDEKYLDERAALILANRIKLELTSFKAGEDLIMSFCQQKWVGFCFFF